MSQASVCIQNYVVICLWTVNGAQSSGKTLPLQLKGWGFETPCVCECVCPLIKKKTCGTTPHVANI